MTVYLSHDYTTGISQGGLLHPNPATVDMVIYSYIIINKLIKENVFIHSNFQRILATDVTLNALADDDCFLSSNFCEDGHSTQKLERMIIWASTNTLINNYCSMENNVLAETRTTGKESVKQLASKS